MIRQICSIKPEDVAIVRSSELLAKLEDFDLIWRERRLRWFGHVERSSGAVRTVCDIQIDGRRGGGDSNVRLYLQLVNYLEGGPLMWMMPLHLHVNKKTDYDMMILIDFPMHIDTKYIKNGIVLFVF